MASWKKTLKAAVKAAVQVLLNHPNLILPPVLKKAGLAQPKGRSRFAAARILAGIDGRQALVGGAAKYALRKGLPSPGQRTMAVENEPHEPSQFSGTIPEGYGAGKKKLIWYGQAVVRQGGKVFLAPASYHRHDAKRAGLHFDLAVGVDPGSASYDLYIPDGPAEGWYRVTRTIFGEKKWILPAVRLDKPLVIMDRGSWKVQIAPQGAMVQYLPNRMFTRLETPGPLLEKPKVSLIGMDRVGCLPLDSEEWVVERKFDGSLANAEVDLETGVAWMRSHRDTGNCYLGRLPAVETFPGNRLRSPILLERMMWKPAARTVVLRGELVHPNGASKVAGILNSSPAKARDYQERNGPVEFWAWDIVRMDGRDVSRLPYAERRVLLEAVMEDLHRRNPRWHVIPRFQPGGWNEERFVRDVESLPLPYGEGLVVKGPDGWFKIKRSDEYDLILKDVLPGTGKYADSVGRIVVQNPATGETGEVGSFTLTDQERQYLWENRESARGAVVRVRALELTTRGVPRAGVMEGFHPDKSAFHLPA